MNKALLSNKEDTEQLLVVVGNQQEQINNMEKINNNLKLEIEKQNELVGYMKKNSKNSNIWCNVLIPLAPIAVASFGLYELNNGNPELGKALLQAGSYSLIGLEVIYQSGHFAFKCW